LLNKRKGTTNEVNDLKVCFRVSEFQDFRIFCYFPFPYFPFSIFLFLSSFYIRNFEKNLIAMLKIFSPKQVRKADAFTIQNEPISSIDLMERAANSCVEWMKNFRDLSNKNILVFCGPGNNGGDGLAISRMLHGQNIKVTAFIPEESAKLSEDFSVNLGRAKENRVDLQNYSSFNPEQVTENTLIVDALFGSGLSKPLEGNYKELAATINKSTCITIAIDIPSGLFADTPAEPSKNTVVKADYTLSFQFPKLAFLFPENEYLVSDWHILPIGLHPDFINSEPCKNHLVEYADAKAILKPRSRFSHKGTFGHALLIGGSKGKIGATVLMGKSCLCSGAGLVTVHLPGCGYAAIQTAVPEVMASVDEDENECTQLPRLDPFSALAAGPGLGTGKNTINMLKHLIQESRVPLLLDADAINILSDNPTWLAFLPKGTVLTPHPGEFGRLAGKTSNSFDRLDILRAFCIKYSLNVVLKGAYTVVCSPLGNCYFNPTGNPGMATGGSGDALSGLISGLLAQGYTSTEACILGVYIHGSAGDLAAEETGYEALVAGDIINHFGKAFQELY
jgi:ADP-dependent NAD(P)H-hydrate dehydratase / NAD(P)H-hydrate epimerase